MGPHFEMAIHRLLMGHQRRDSIHRVVCSVVEVCNGCCTCIV
ncbi:hypothetical protein CGRA01v4_14554 [Colletotrichum graminicola]|nr:hypothetical protein CGRA01v4_14554 [Colletotrichum graminicola]